MVGIVYIYMSNIILRLQNTLNPCVDEHPNQDTEGTRMYQYMMTEKIVNTFQVYIWISTSMFYNDNGGLHDDSAGCWSYSVDAVAQGCRDGPRIRCCHSTRYPTKLLL